MATYQYCTGTTLQDVNVTISATTCGDCETWVGGGCDYERCFLDLTIYLDTVLTEDLDVWYTNHYHRLVEWTGGGSGSYEEDEDQTTKVTIPAGVTAYTVTDIGESWENKQCSWRENCVDVQYDDSDIKTWDDWGIGSQQTLPVCGSCAIAITGYTITAPTIRGDADGSIYVAISGSSNTCVYKIDGAYDHNTAQGYHTYTGLEAGEYTLLVMSGSDASCFYQANYTVPDGEFRTGDFIVQEPSDLTAVENPIILTLQTAIASTSPLPSKSTFDVSGTTSDGDSITIALEYPQEYTATFYAKGFPDRSNYFLATNLTDDSGNVIGGNTDSEIATSIGEVLLNDSVINRLYYIRVSGTTIYLEAKENNSELDLDTSTVTIVGSSITLTETQDGVSAYDGQLAANYSLYSEINVDIDSQYGDTLSVDNFNRVTEIDLPFSQDNIHRFDLSDVLKNFVSTPKIDFTLTASTTIADMIASYYVSYGEKYPLVANQSTKKKRSKGSTDIKYFINSALAWEDVNYMDDYIGGTGVTKSDVKFLTNAPNPKFVQRDGNEFLYFILAKNYGADLTVVGDLYFYDGTSITGQTLYTISTGGTNYGGVFCVPSGYEQLGLEDYETWSGGTRKIRKVEFKVCQTTGVTCTALTEERAYRYEIDEMPRRYGVAFLNKLGTWDIFDFSGEIIDGVEHSNVSYQVPREVNSQGASPRGFQSNTVFGSRVTKTIACNTGWINEDTFNWLMELLSSNRIYNYTEDDQPFLITQAVNYIKSSNDDLYSIDIKFKETLHQNNISV